MVEIRILKANLLVNLENKIRKTKRYNYENIEMHCMVKQDLEMTVDEIAEDNQIRSRFQ